MAQTKVEQAFQSGRASYYDYQNGEIDWDDASYRADHGRTQSESDAFWDGWSAASDQRMGR